jgi:hypothetical protein
MTNDRPQRTTTITPDRRAWSAALAELSRRLSGPSRLVSIRVVATRSPRRVRPIRSWDRLTRV